MFYVNQEYPVYQLYGLCGCAVFLMHPRDVCLWLPIISFTEWFMAPRTWICSNNSQCNIFMSLVVIKTRTGCTWTCTCTHVHDIMCTVGQIIGFATENWGMKPARKYFSWETDLNTSNTLKFWNKNQVRVKFSNTVILLYFFQNIADFKLNSGKWGYWSAMYNGTKGI